MPLATGSKGCPLACYIQEDKLRATDENNVKQMQKSEVNHSDRHDVSSHDLKEQGQISDKETRNFTCEAHESAFSGLLPQPLHIFVVDVDQVNSL